MDDYPVALLQGQIAARAHATATIQATYAAHQQLFRARHQAGIVLVLLHDREVGRLPDEVASVIGLGVTTRIVTISASTQRHILERRQVASEADVDICLNRVEEALRHLRHFVTPQRDPRVWELIGHVPPHQRLLLLAIKLVPAAASSSGKDELWLRTVHPCGKATLRRRQAQGKLTSFGAA
jgi:hypothetical protein